MSREAVSDDPFEPTCGPLSKASRWRKVTRDVSDLLTTVTELRRRGWVFLGLVVDEAVERDSWRLLYLWYGSRTPWLVVEVTADDDLVPSTSEVVFAADWQEREAEDLYGIRFGGHPLLGDFVLHDEDWPEGLAPMRKDFRRAPLKAPDRPYRPPQIVDAPGGFVMPVGPVFSGVQESIRFLLETVGEEIIYAHVRSFYKYRAVEKHMEGRTRKDALLLAERVDGMAAFAHGLALSQAAEAIDETAIPPRALALRIFWAEVERIRSHVKTLAGILESTGLNVPANLLAAHEEQLLELCGECTGHRYLFGLNIPGGLTRDFADETLTRLAQRIGHIWVETMRVMDRLTFDNSFLDRVESVGHLTPEQAEVFGVVGPVARASGVARDLRVWQPYSGYDQFSIKIPVEYEGDGYARVRILRQEIEIAKQVIDRVVGDLPDGPVFTAPIEKSGEALGAVEAPSGALAYWIKTNAEGLIQRSRIITPGMANWHAFPTAVRYFAFQDFPIIMATFGMSVADADR